MMARLPNQVHQLSFWDTFAWKRMQAFAADFIVLMLGTNDSKSPLWGTDDVNIGAWFRHDYEAMLTQMTSLRPDPDSNTQPTQGACARTWVCVPPRAVKDRFGISDARLHKFITPIIRSVAEDQGLPVLDMAAALQRDVRRYFGVPGPGDGIHPVSEGAKAVAEVAAAAVLEALG